MDDSDRLEIFRRYVFISLFDNHSISDIALFFPYKDLLIHTALLIVKAYRYAAQNRVDNDKIISNDTLLVASFYLAIKFHIDLDINIHYLTKWLKIDPETIIKAEMEILKFLDFRLYLPILDYIVEKEEDSVEKNKEDKIIEGRCRGLKKILNVRNRMKSYKVY